MKRLLWLLVPLAAACSSSVALPPGDVLSWTMPNQRTDNSALPLSEIASTTILWGASGGPYNVGSQVVPSPATTVTIPRGAGSGTVCYVAIITDTGGLVSTATGQVCVIVKANPKPATGLTAS